jgi:hypothetical protein
MIDSEKDVEYRIQHSNHAFATYQKVWRSKAIHESSKLRLYNSLIRPILTYNMAASASPGTGMEKMDSHHRRQLRSIMGKSRSDIHTEDLYERAKCHNISIDISKYRLRLLGHILRQGTQTPAYKSMQLQYITRVMIQNLGTPMGTPTQWLKLSKRS